MLRPLYTLHQSWGAAMLWRVYVGERGWNEGLSPVMMGLAAPGSAWNS